jgi:4-carboxymuconolactone decarboxylase
MRPLPPSHYPPTGRVGPPAIEDMTAAARAMYEDSLRLFGGPAGPRMPLLHLPELAEAWGKLNRAINSSGLPPRYLELAIITVAAHWRAEMEWLMHAGEAARHGLGAGQIEAIRLGDVPQFDEENDRIVFDYTQEIQTRLSVSDSAYSAARQVLGDAGLVALTVAIGHYTNVAMTLRAHRLPIPEGIPAAFSEGEQGRSDC